jgi:geranylgeranyl pyrophosphate synthase
MVATPSRPAAEDADADVGLVARVEMELARHLYLHADRDGAKSVHAMRMAMEHALMSGGKRFRPVVVLEVARAVHASSTPEEALRLAMPAAIAVELVHTYSLIHDDLPALDNDVVRRGQPTVHVAFDEATAILAGDSLLTDSFGVVARAEHRAAAQVLELSLAAGSAGMVAGQVEDLANEGKEAHEVDLLAIHRRKTARLLGAAAAMGALAVDARDDVVDKMRAYGIAMGIAFQIADDVLDAAGDPARAGKSLGRDAERAKVTYASRYGVDGARTLACAHVDEAIAHIEFLGARGSALKSLATLAALRDR